MEVQQVLVCCLLSCAKASLTLLTCPMACRATPAEAAGARTICADEMCLVLPPRYQALEVPSIAGQLVAWDAKLLKVTGVDLHRDKIDLGVFVRLRWTDPDLALCDCSGGSRTDAKMDVVEEVWTPDFVVKERVSMTRQGPLDMQLVAGAGGGVALTLALEFRLTVKCRLEAKFYPFDRHACPVRLKSLTHDHGAVTFVRGDIGSRHIRYKDIKVSVLELCEEEARGLDGFKLVLEREGVAMQKMYGFVKAICLVVATFATQLPVFWRHGGMQDLSAGLVEAAVVMFYFLFDLTFKSAPTSEGVDSVVEGFAFGNDLVNVYGVYLLLVLLLRRVWLEVLAWPVDSLQALLRHSRAAVTAAAVFVFAAEDALYWLGRESATTDLPFHGDRAAGEL